MPLGKQVGPNPSDIVLDGTQVPLAKKGDLGPLFRPMSVVAKRRYRSIKMKLDMEVGLGHGHTALDGDQAPLPKGAQPPIVGPCLLWPNGWMDPDATCYGSRPRPRRLCVTWGPSSPRKKGKKGTAPAQFSAHVYCGRTAGWMKTPHGTEVDLGPLC